MNNPQYITEADVVAFLHMHLARIKAQFPDSYSALNVEVRSYSTEDKSVVWQTYCNALPDSGSHSKALPTLDQAIAHALTFEAKAAELARAAQLRRDAEEMIAKADAIERDIAAA
jgi:hypothetical protein